MRPRDLLRAHRVHVSGNRAEYANRARVVKEEWDTSTLETMERTAKAEADGCCSLRIRGHWLEVRWVDGAFEYQWGLNIVPRAVAAEVRRSAS
jgi:hypothetical protein